VTIAVTAQPIAGAGSRQLDSEAGTGWVGGGATSGCASASSAVAVTASDRRVCA
jgi:hypothetical protein